MKTKFRHSFNGKLYTVTFEPNLGQTGDGKKIYGYCTPPDAPNRKIKLLLNQSDEDLIDTAIHESLHACGFDVLDHEWVERSASETARLLIKLGIGSVPSV